jgi:hypothetical protein
MPAPNRNRAGYKATTAVSPMKGRFDTAQKKEAEKAALEKKRKNDEAMKKFLAASDASAKGVVVKNPHTTGTDNKYTSKQTYQDFAVTGGFVGGAELSSLSAPTESATVESALSKLRKEDKRKAAENKKKTLDEFKQFETERQTKLASGELPNVLDRNRPGADLSKYRPKPQPPALEFRRSDRTSWAKIQNALNNQIEPNALYTHDNLAYDLTTYSITMFQLSEAELFDRPLGEVLLEIKTVKDLKARGAVIIAQTAGTDEFYIDSFEFTSIHGGPGTLATNLDMVIKSPYQADLVDYIFKSSLFLGVRNSQKIPMFILLTWAARDTETQSPVPDLGISRCFAMDIKDIALNYTEGGAVYTISGVRYNESNLNQLSGVIQEDITIGGETVGDIIAMLRERLAAPQMKGADRTIFPDQFEFEMDPEMLGYKLVNKDQWKFSSFRNRMNSYDLRKSVSAIAPPPNPAGARSAAAIIMAHEEAANSSPQERTRSQIELDIVQWMSTAEFKVGTPITTIIESILSSTKEMQAHVTGLADPQGDTAQQEKTDPADIKRKMWQIEPEIILTHYDDNKRMYAARRIYRVFLKSDPELARDEENTKQDKQTSADRLYGILGHGMLKKAYNYYYTGLNTEVKSVDFNFDNHWINAIDYFAGMLNAGRMEHGNIIKQGLHAGPTNPDWNDLRETHEQEPSVMSGAVKKLDIEISRASAGGPMSYLQEAHKKEMDSKKALRKQLEEQLAMLEKTQQVNANVKAAILAGRMKLNVVTENYTNKFGELESSIRETGDFYFTEIRPKFSGIAYVSDLQNEAPDPGVMWPVTFVNVPQANQLNQGMPIQYDRGQSLLSQIFNNRTGGNMIEVNLEIRGDPHWICEAYSDKVNTNSISPMVQEEYCILLASQGNEYNNAGIMQINERNGLNNVYNVIQTTHRFTGGEFTQTLNMQRVDTIDLNAVIRAPDEYREAAEIQIGGGGIDF